MKIEILQENLVKGLQQAVRFSTHKINLPILSMVKMVAKDNLLTLMSTNMEVGVEVGVSAKVIESGELVVPAKLLGEYVATLSAGTIKLEVLESVLVVSGVKRKAKVAIEANIGDFPQVIPEGEFMEFTLNLGELSKLVQLVEFSASDDPARPVLGSLLWNKTKKGLKVVATDGYRLSLVDGLAIDGDGDFKILLPARSLVEVERLLREVGGKEVLLGYSEKEKILRFSAGDVKIATRLVDGDFPDYERILPKKQEIVVNVNTVELLEACKASMVFARENSNIVAWKMTKENSLIVSSKAQSAGEQVSEVDVTPVAPGEGEIAFNGKFLVELLSRFGDGDVIFSMSGPLQAGVFENKKLSFIHVIMPVRI